MNKAIKNMGLILKDNGWTQTEGKEHLWFKTTPKGVLKHIYLDGGYAYSSFGDNTYPTPKIEDLLKGANSLMYYFIEN